VVHFFLLKTHRGGEERARAFRKLFDAENERTIWGKRKVGGISLKRLVDEHKVVWAITEKCGGPGEKFRSVEHGVERAAAGIRGSQGAVVHQRKTTWW